MNKKEWETSLKNMKDLRKTAKNNMELAQQQVEELDFNISNYETKIKTFK